MTLIAVYRPSKRVTIRSCLQVDPESNVDTSGHQEYLVVTPLFQTMERDGTARCALHTASIMAEGLVRKVEGLERHVAAFVSKDALDSCVVEHKFILLECMLQEEGALVPEGWRKAPERCGAGFRTVLQEDERRMALSISEVNAAAMEKALRAESLMRKPNEPDWQYARRARQLLGAKVVYDYNADFEVNEGKPAANVFKTCVAQCGRYAEAYQNMMAINEIPCHSSVGEMIGKRGAGHVVNEVFLDGCGWIPLEPQDDTGTLAGVEREEWGPPDITGFAKSEIVEISVDGRSTAGHVHDAKRLIPRLRKDAKRLARESFARYDKNKNGFLEKDEARKMLKDFLGLNMKASPKAPKVLDSIVAAFDTNGDGKINLQELTDALDGKGPAASAILPKLGTIDFSQCLMLVYPVRAPVLEGGDPLIDENGITVGQNWLEDDPEIGYKGEPCDPDTFTVIYRDEQDSGAEQVQIAGDEAQALMNEIEARAENWFKISGDYEAYTLQLLAKAPRGENGEGLSLELQLVKRLLLDAQAGDASAMTQDKDFLEIVQSLVDQINEFEELELGSSGSQDDENYYWDVTADGQKGKLKLPVEFDLNTGELCAVNDDVCFMSE